MHPSLGPLSEIDRWTRKQRLINNLLEQLKLTLTNGISRKQADQWRRRWFRLYTYHGQL